MRHVVELDAEIDVEIDVDIDSSSDKERPAPDLPEKQRDVDREHMVTCGLSAGK